MKLDFHDKIFINFFNGRRKGSVRMRNEINVALYSNNLLYMVSIETELQRNFAHLSYRVSQIIRWERKLSLEDTDLLERHFSFKHHGFRQNPQINLFFLREKKDFHSYLLLVFRRTFLRDVKLIVRDFLTVKIRSPVIGSEVMKMKERSLMLL